MAIAGVRNLAIEILAFWSLQGDGKPLSVCVPGGTCTTALLLHRELQSLQQNQISNTLDIRVIVVPCVGDQGYARRQMMAFNAQTNWDPQDIPTVLPPNPSLGAPSYFGQAPESQGEYYTFAVPHAEILETFVELRDKYRLLVDLLYGAPSWNIMLRHWRSKTKLATQNGDFDDNHPLDGRELMYVHSGGLEGTGSQLLRYKQKGLIDFHEIQLPGRNSAK